MPLHSPGGSMDECGPLLKLENISKSFGERRIIDGLSLEVHKGEILCLLGPSGCGKTTLLRLVAGLDMPDTGTITLRGLAVFEGGKTLIPPQRREIGFVFQDLALWPHLSVAGNLDFVLGSRNIPKAERYSRIRQMLGLVRLASFDTSYPETLSGGEQQRLAIARALVGNPALLLLDEPLSSLDLQLKIELQKQVRLWLRDLKATAVLVTHDQAEAMALADRLAVMHQGRIVQLGTPQEVQESPSHDFVQHFLSSSVSYRDN